MIDDDRLTAIEAQMQELLDRQAIIKRNARGNDRFDAALAASTYHDDGLHQVGQNRVPGPGYRAHANVVDGKLFDANLHNVTMHTCEIDGDIAHAESYSLGMFLDRGGETGRVLASR